MFMSRLKSKNIFRRSVSYHGDPQDSQPPASPKSPSRDAYQTPSSDSPLAVGKPKQSKSFSNLRYRRKLSNVKAQAIASEKGGAVQLGDRKKQQSRDAVADDTEDDLRSREGNASALGSSLISVTTTSAPTSNTGPDFVVDKLTPGSSLPVNSLESQGHERSADLRKSRLQGKDEEPVQSIDEHVLLSRKDADIIKALLQGEAHCPPQTSQLGLNLQGNSSPAKSATTAPASSMTSRKVWVKRPNAAATLVLIRQDDMVDEAKEAILRKYGNQLGRHFDAPDITMRLSTRGQPGERVLNPDELLCKALDAAYPGGQSVDEALLVDVPTRRTPRPSPRVLPGHHGTHHHYYHDDGLRPHEDSGGYFPQMPPANNMGPVSPLLTSVSHESHPHDTRKMGHERNLSALHPGQMPPLPSPGALSRKSYKSHRPTAQRTHTASPTTLTSSVSSRANRPRLDSSASADKHLQIASSTAALPTPPIPEASKASTAAVLSVPDAIPTTPRLSSPRPPKLGRKTKLKQRDDAPTQLPSAILDTAVPPINVLIVEDNMINMRLLEQFVRRLGVRWQTAVNGREAVNKWKLGGFHLVLMDIQLPIMSGLEATKEIRRLERVNNIGVLSSASKGSPDLEVQDETKSAEDGAAGKSPEDTDKLFDEEGKRLFKSPVIIVALTASNLQSDRHEALAAGCNDFLTKPVNFVWFERKVKEWGCMQALIDFDGWRKWKDFAEMNGLKDPAKGPGAAGAKGAKKPLTKAAKVPDAKTLDSSGLDKVVDGSDVATVKAEANSDAKDFQAAADLKAANDRKGQLLSQQDAPDAAVGVPAK